LLPSCKKEKRIIIKNIGAFSIIIEKSTVFVNRGKVLDYVIENIRNVLSGNEAG
jgi:hypothetical protein